MPRPRLLDLFCGADALHWSSDNGHLSALRDGIRVAAQDSEVLFPSVFQPLCMGRHQDSSVSSLREGLPCQRYWRCQPSALLTSVRQEPQRQNHQGMDGSAPRGDEALQRESGGKESRRLENQGSSTAFAFDRSIGRLLHRVRSQQSLVASCRLHPDSAWVEVSTPSALGLRPGALR